MSLPRLRHYLLLPGMVAAAACIGEEIRWIEDVQLHDGNVIALKRRIELTATGFPVQKRGFDKSYEFCHTPTRMHWKMRGGYRPDIFDIVVGKAYLHVPIVGCTQCQLHDFPKDNALAFVWENGAWKQIPYEAFPELLRWNLLQHDKGDENKFDVSGHITLAQKHKLDFGSYYAQKHQGWTRLSQQPSYPRCTKCREEGRIQTDRTAEVFLPTGSDTCNW